MAVRIIAGFLALLVVGCTSPKRNPEVVNLSADVVSVGMSESQVVGKIGSPSSSNIAKDTDGFQRLFAAYKEQQKRAGGGYLFRELTVIYLNGKVEKTAYSERTGLKPLSGVRMTHGTIELR